MESNKHRGGVAARKLPQRFRWEEAVARPRPLAAGWTEVARLTEI